MEQVKAYLYRLAPFALWIAMISGQATVQLTLFGYGTKARYYRVLKGLSIVIFPIFSIIFWGFNQIDPYYYNRLTKEDNIVEWLTVVFLFLAAVLAIMYAVISKRYAPRYFWFFVLFSISCSVFAIEEISWGQRVFGFESPGYFVEHSDQQEINVHNVVNEQFSIRTKHIAALALFAYGVILPISALIPSVRLLAEKFRIMIPSKILVPGFVLASLMTWDRYFSGQDEEVAEFFFSTLLFLSLVFYFWESRNSATLAERYEG
jgi:hypothetical protein